MVTFFHYLIFIISFLNFWFSICFITSSSSSSLRALTTPRIVPYPFTVTVVNSVNHPSIQAESIWEFLQNRKYQGKIDRLISPNPPTRKHFIQKLPYMHNGDAHHLAEVSNFLKSLLPLNFPNKKNSDHQITNTNV